METTLGPRPQTRDTYRAIAKRGALLFLLFTTLSSLNPMYAPGPYSAAPRRPLAQLPVSLLPPYPRYRYALDPFLRAFDRALDSVPATEDVAQRASDLESAVTWELFYFVARSPTPGIFLHAQQCL